MEQIGENDEWSYKDSDTIEYKREPRRLRLIVAQTK